ncbi:MAG: hypothetical protein BIFFINMI_01393 [Phycisphaerae bacterium]|nr:hypothetical protein [Phycisphaerae bacterium]
MVERTTLWLLADVDQRWRYVHEHISRDRGPWLSLLFWAVLLGAGCTLLILAVRYARRVRASGKNHITGPWRLFFRLIWHAPLSMGGRWMLFCVARRTRRRQPAAILLTPEALLAATREWAGGEEAMWTGRTGRRLASVSRVLFGHPLTRPGKG